MRKKLFLINGPNLNLLGKRNPAVYGTQTLQDVASRLQLLGDGAGLTLISLQSNSESQLIDWVQQTPGEADGIILNAGGLTHTSIALRDAVEYAREQGVPSIEVHLSDIHRREPFRNRSYLTEVCVGTFCGKGIESYEEGMVALLQRLLSPLPKHKGYPKDALQCDECGGHGCTTCDDQGWLPRGHPRGRYCHKDTGVRCINPIPPSQFAVYCSTVCAHEDE